MTRNSLRLLFQFASVSLGSLLLFVFLGTQPAAAGGGDPQPTPPPTLGQLYGLPGSQPAPTPPPDGQRYVTIGSIDAVDADHALVPGATISVLFQPDSILPASYQVYGSWQAPSGSVANITIPIPDVPGNLEFKATLVNQNQNLQGVSEYGHIDSGGLIIFGPEEVKMDSLPLP